MIQHVPLYEGMDTWTTRFPQRASCSWTTRKSNPLTMADLRNNRSALESSAPFFAYLAACSTGAIRHRQLPDECIHLVSGVQLAGVRHVTGKLWEVSDWHYAQVAKRFYKTLLPDSEGEDKVKGKPRANSQTTMSVGHYTWPFWHCETAYLNGNPPVRVNRGSMVLGMAVKTRMGVAKAMTRPKKRMKKRKKNKK